jgi:hypothetical protein
VALGPTARRLPHGKRPRPGRQPEGSTRLRGPRPDTWPSARVAHGMAHKSAVGANQLLDLPPTESMVPGARPGGRKRGRPPQRGRVRAGAKERHLPARLQRAGGQAKEHGRVLRAMRWPESAVMEVNVLPRKRLARASLLGNTLPPTTAHSHTQGIAPGFQEYCAGLLLNSPSAAPSVMAPAEGAQGAPRKPLTEACLVSGLTRAIIKTR